MRYRLRRASAFQRFAVATGVAVIVLGLLLGGLMAVLAKRDAMDEASKRADVISQTLLARPLDRIVRAGELTRAQERSLERAIRPAIEQGKILGVRIWSSQGELLHAQGLSVGPTTLPGTALRAAARGTRSSTVLQVAAPRRPAGQSAGAGGKGAPPGKVVATYLPVVARSTKRPLGIVQAYQPYGPVAAEIANLRLRLWLGTAAALALLYGTLLLLVRRVAEQLQRQSAEREHQALHDPLTSLGNRALFTQQADEALRRRPGDDLAALVLMDLDRFKEINDALGHFNGDLVIQRSSQRIREILRDGDIVARLGGDEFAMLLPHIASREALTPIIERLRRAFKEPFVVSGLALEVDLSIGVAICPEHGKEVSPLLQAADVAMYAAKREHSGWKTYAQDQHRYSPTQLGLVAELRRALENEELVFHYQPKVALATGEVEGVEALVRWNHRHRGLLYPDEFIPLAEHTSVVRPLTLHLIEIALVQLREWEKTGVHLDVAVNLSAQMLLDNELPGEIAQMLFRHGVQARRLELEVTESSIMQDPRRATALLERLSELGVRIAIDDFGTGYSSLLALKQLPVSTLKIDKSFVIDMENDEKDEAIVRSTVSLGNSLGLDVVAEGVETQAAWSKLAGWQCDHAQGYFLSKPLPAAEFTRWLAAYRELGVGGTLNGGAAVRVDGESAREA